VKIAQIAIPTPLNRVFDYYWPDQSDIRAGQRVTVPFGKRTLIGVVLGETKSASVSAERMRAVKKIHDATPVIPTDLIELLRWAARYYHHPIGEVLSSALPSALRKGAPNSLPTIKRYRVVSDPSLNTNDLARAPVQRALLQTLASAGAAGCDVERLKDMSNV